MKQTVFRIYGLIWLALFSCLLRMIGLDASLFKNSRIRLHAALYAACAVLVIVGDINPAGCSLRSRSYSSLLRVPRFELRK